MTDFSIHEFSKMAILDEEMIGKFHLKKRSNFKRKLRVLKT